MRRPALALALLAACTDSPAGPDPATSTSTGDATSTASSGEPTSAATSTPPTTGTTGTTGEPDAPPVFGFTHHRRDGNRLVTTAGSLVDGAGPLDIALAAAPAWIVAVPGDTGTIWAAIAADGAAEAFVVHDLEVAPIALDPPALPAGEPPLLARADGLARLVRAPAATAALAPPTPLDPPALDHLAFRADDGDLVFWSGGETGRLPRDLLVDARLVVDDLGRLAALAPATDVYPHGVLGDALEGGGLVIADAAGVRLAAATIPAPAVIEGLAPIWGDIDGDGARELVVTISDASVGARIAAFTADGALLAEGPAIGTGMRWRHPLAVAPFGPAGEPEIAAIRTPHIGGVAEFYRRDGDALVLVATATGVSSHTIGSRDLDQALAGDFDGDGRIELLVPNQAHDRLIALRREGPSDVVTAFELALPSTLSANLAAADDGARLVVGAGLADATLRLWVAAARP